MSSHERRIFAAEEASELAGAVVDHDPGTPRDAMLVPGDRAAAAAGVRELAVRLKGLPRSIRSALKRASDSAGFLSDDRLQGIAELIQNADDLRATHAYIAVDTAGSRLLFQHNGAGLTLHDVWALAIPWLSLKVADEDQLGRYGIGLKTLQSLSETLEVSEGHFDVRLAPDTIVPLDRSISWPGNPDIGMGTVFAVPFAPGAVSSDDVAGWLAAWDEAGLVFLRNLTRISLINGTGEPVTELRIEHAPDEELDLAHGRTLRRTVTASDGRQWVVYTRRVPAPEGEVRAGKAQGAVTPLALAFPQFEGDEGHLHIGLPVRSIKLPFRVLAQFDPLANRRDIANTDWNLALIPFLSDLWLDTVLDCFSRAPALGWAAVPLDAEFAEDERSTGRLRDALEHHLMTRARIAFASTLTLDGGDGPLPLADLAYEAAELADVLTPDDVRTVAERKGTVTVDARSADDRWRLVLSELDELEAETPTLVDVQDALVLLNDTERLPEFVAALVGIAVESGLTRDLRVRPCLVLEDGSRVTPGDRTGVAVLLPATSGQLWGTLGMGSRLHAAFGERDRWALVSEWLITAGVLRADASDRAALTVLASAGESGDRLPDPLTDSQLDALRRALEDLGGDPERQELGPGIGKAIKLDAVSYDASGSRQVSHARPCDAYIVEHDRGAWSVAASRTAGLVWLHRRYATAIKTDRGREGIGAQRLFRLLGAESAPRLELHPRNVKRYANYAVGVPRWVGGSPARRQRILQEHQATYTVKDWIAPDLEAVLENIANEKDLAQRRRRAVAVLDTLTRAWDRLSDRASVMAASEDYGWVDKGQVESWWISSAASIAWLTSEKGTPAAPDDLSIRSNVNVLFHGDEPELYLDPLLDIDQYREVLARVGVAGDPSVSQLIDRLEAVREETLDDPTAAQNSAAPIYQALADEVRGNRLGQLNASAARARFGRDRGLVATNAGWRRPSVVLAGPPIFGDLGDFVPSVSGTDQLWRLLGIPTPTADHARGVLSDLAKAKRSDQMVMLEALRLLAASPRRTGEPSAAMRRSSVWLGDQWTNKRPVYAISNPLIAEALRGKLPIWAPGGALSQFESLIDAYGLTRLDTPDGEVLNVEAAAYDPDLSLVFSRAVDNLRADLATSDPTAEASLTMPWKTLAGFCVAVLPCLQVRLTETSEHTDETVSLDSWLDAEAETLYVSDASAAGRPSAGGYAVAAAFGGDARRISHDWVAAWSAADDGYRAEQITTAARLDAEAKMARDAANAERLRALGELGKARRKEPPGKRTKGSKKVTQEVAGGHRTRDEADSAAPSGRPGRTRPTHRGRGTGWRRFIQPGAAEEAEGQARDEAEGAQHRQPEEDADRWPWRAQLHGRRASGSRHPTGASSSRG